MLPLRSHMSRSQISTSLSKTHVFLQRPTEEVTLFLRLTFWKNFPRKKFTPQGCRSHNSSREWKILAIGWTKSLILFQKEIIGKVKFIFTMRREAIAGST